MISYCDVCARHFRMWVGGRAPVRCRNCGRSPAFDCYAGNPWVPLWCWGFVLLAAAVAALLLWRFAA